MEHTYLLRPGRWRAERTYYDETGRSFPWPGRQSWSRRGRSGIWTAGWRFPGPLRSDSRTAMSSGRRTAPLP
ncbi:hypothetical protein K440107A6_14310 [Lawsonibacter asaccharolyticus]